MPSDEMPRISSEHRNKAVNGISSLAQRIK